jgi:putative flavoprotein involved in K+ transport
MGVGRPWALPNGYRGTTGVSFAVRVMSAIDTVIIGAGQAGLALSRLLTEARHDHVVLERGRVGERWRSERWDSLALLTPNWANRLPHGEVPDDPAGYASRSEFVSRLQRYARSFGAPVRERTTVTAVERDAGGFRVRTDRGEWRAGNVVVATGDCAVPAVPWFAASAPAPVEQLHASRYRAPASLAPGGVLVVGAGPSGHQIAHELALARRSVVLAVGRHARIVRRYRSRDIWAWLDALGDLSRPPDELSRHPRRRRPPALPLDGRQGGRTIDLDVLAAAGVRIAGRLEGFAGTHALFGAGLDAAIADADERLGRLLARIDRHIDSRADAHAFPPREQIAPIQVPSPTPAIDLAAESISTIVWATGYHRHFPWLRIPEVIGADGGILHDHGRTAVSGLFVLGMRWQSRMTSHQIGGVGPDAAFLAAQIAADADGGRALRAAA